jgi:hypothetical protein
MATKHIALGTVIAVDTAGGSSYTTITLAIDATPPARKRARIPQTALSDTLATNAPGIEEASEYVFNQYWHPTDSQHASIDTLFNAKTDGSWKITYPFSVTIADTFTGWVSDLEPAVLQSNGMIMRKVTIQRTSDITRT